jgi:hypothetical protein
VRAAPAGQLTSPHQAGYDHTHERRLRLIRVLLDVDGLKVAAIAEVLAAADDPGRSVHTVLGVAADRIAPRYSGAQDGELEAAREETGELIKQRGWRVGSNSPAAEALADALPRRPGSGTGPSPSCPTTTRTSWTAWRESISTMSAAGRVWMTWWRAR